MDDEYDIFANVNRFCNTNILDKLESSGEDDGVIDKDLLLQLGENTPDEIEIKSKKKKVDVPKNEVTIESDVHSVLPVTSNSVPEPSISSTRSSRRSRRNAPPEQTPVNSNIFSAPSARSIRHRRRGNACPETIQDLPRPPAVGQRNRRHIMQEIVARLPTVDTIDLITSPLPVITGVVNVDLSDEDDDLSIEHVKGSVANASLADISSDLSFDSDNPEISVKVKWSDKIERFQIRKHQKFADLLNIFSERENVAVKDVVLNLDDHIIGPNDSPDSINYKIYQFISGRIIENSSQTSSIHMKKDKNILDLKIQLATRKQPLIVKLKKSDKFKILYVKCAEELKVPTNQVKLSFDGDILNINETPDDLDLEGGELFDCRLNNK